MPTIPTALTKIAAGLPKYGVTAFCPTTVACSAAVLERTLESVRHLKAQPSAHGAQVIGAHLESNFVNPEYKGAQPGEYLYRPSSEEAEPILLEILRSRQSVSIVTLAPELDGALDMIRSLAEAGIRVSLGHSGASFEIAAAAVDAGARHATHLFNRMPPLHHRDPGLAGAVLTRDEVAAEIICDGMHVRSPMIQVAIAAKGPDRIMAITDGTAASGLGEGGVASLGGRRICVRAWRRLSGRRHDGGKRGDDGSRVPVSRASRGTVAERCVAALLDHASGSAGASRSRRHRRWWRGRSGGARSGAGGQTNLCGRPPRVFRDLISVVREVPGVLDRGPFPCALAKFPARAAGSLAFAPKHGLLKRHG